MSYITVYEITRDSVQLWFPVVFIFIALGCIGVWWEFRNTGGLLKAARRFLLLPVCLWLLVFYVYSLGQRPYLQAYKSGNYLSVEGPVEHSSWTGKRECFTVHGAELCHSCVDVVTINFSAVDLSAALFPKAGRCGWHLMTAGFCGWTGAV
jgi:hypothetical protein